MSKYIESKLCLGCWSFGGNESTYWGAQDETNADEIISYAIDKGYRFFDTAPVYNDGLSEIALGKVLSNYDRDSYAVNTKIIFKEDTNIEKELVASLKRLNLDYVDLYMIHWPIASFENDARFVVEEFERLKAKGLMKNYAISNFGVKQLDWVLKEGFKPFVNQLPYSIVSRAIEFEVTDVCQKNNINIMAYMVLLQGILSGKYETIDEIPVVRRRTRHFHHSRSEIRHGEEGVEQELVDTLKVLKSSAKEYNVPVSLLATSWCLQHPALQTVIVGVRTLEQLKAGIDAVEFDMPKELYEKLSATSEPIKQILGNNVDLWQGEKGKRTY